MECNMKCETVANSDLVNKCSIPINNTAVLHFK